LKISLNDNTDIGSFKFIAGALNTNVDTAVKYFIFTLIAVFDPLAVALVLCWNKLIEPRANKKKEEQEALQRIASTPVVEEDLKKKINVTIEPAPQDHVIEVTEMTHDNAKEAKIDFVAAELSTINKKEIPLDVVSNIPVGDEAANDALENDIHFMSLSEEEKAAERARRSRIAGRNNSVITRG
jgi:hypothetical protein